MMLAEASKKRAGRGARATPRQAEEIGHAGAQGHQHIHVGAAAEQRRPRALVETPPDPELHRRRQQALQPARQPFVVMAGARQPAPSMPTICTRKGRLSAAEIQNRRSSARNSALAGALGLPVATGDGRCGKPALAIAATMAADRRAPACNAPAPSRRQN
jgi:hypothetical protein